MLRRLAARFAADACLFLFSHSLPACLVPPLFMYTRRLRNGGERSGHTQPGCLQLLHCPGFLSLSFFLVFFHHTRLHLHLTTIAPAPCPCPRPARALLLTRDVSTMMHSCAS